MLKYFMKRKKDIKKKKNTKRIELNSKEIKVNLEQFQKDIKHAYSTMRKLLPEAITNQKIKSFGNKSHIILPKEYAMKKATIIVKK